MFSYNIFIVLTIFSNGFANPIVNEPSRCCIAKQYSHKTQLISNISQEDGSIDKVYVSVMYIDRYSLFSINNFNRLNTIRHTMVKMDYQQCEQV